MISLCRSALALAAGAALTSCSLLTPEMPIVASAQVAPDFDTYDVTRVGLMPFQGTDVDHRRALDLQEAFFSEFSLTTPFELVLLDAVDLEEVRGSEPHRRGWYLPATILEVAKRYNLDAVMFGTVVREQFYPPQEFSAQVDMVAAETGLVIWSASAHLSAGDERVQRGLQLYYDPDGRSPESWELALVSPSRFARFAAFQIATLL